MMVLEILIELNLKPISRIIFVAGPRVSTLRSIKLELAWLGFTDQQITKLINSEIPYNSNQPEIEIY